MRCEKIKVVVTLLFILFSCHLVHSVLFYPFFSALFDGIWNKMLPAETKKCFISFSPSAASTSPRTSSPAPPEESGSPRTARPDPPRAGPRCRWAALRAAGPRATGATATRAARPSCPTTRHPPVEAGNLPERSSCPRLGATNRATRLWSTGKRPRPLQVSLTWAEISGCGFILTFSCFQTPGFTVSLRNTKFKPESFCLSQTVYKW